MRGSRGQFRTGEFGAREREGLWTPGDGGDYAQKRATVEKKGGPLWIINVALETKNERERGATETQREGMESISSQNRQLMRQDGIQMVPAPRSQKNDCRARAKERRRGSRPLRLA